MGDFSLKVNKYNLFLAVNIIAYLLISAFIVPKSMFDGGITDGFYRQILFVVEGGNYKTSPLYFVHLLRFLVVSPFYYLYSSGFSPFFESLLMVLFLMPVLTVKIGTRWGYCQSFFVYLPILFSYRTVLVMCSISYLFICLYESKKSYLKFFLSMLLANLSSGVVVPWVLIIIMNIKHLSRKYKYIWLLVLGALVVLGFSVSQKIGFFFDGESGGEPLLKRSTFYVSILNEQYLRFAVYSLLFLSWYLITLAKIRFKSFSMSLYSFYFPVLLTFFFEGLGLVSFLIPLCWFFMGIRMSNIRGVGNNYSQNFEG